MRSRSRVVGSQRKTVSPSPACGPTGQYLAISAHPAFLGPSLAAAPSDLSYPRTPACLLLQLPPLPSNLPFTLSFVPHFPHR